MGKAKVKEKIRVSELRLEQLRKYLASKGQEGVEYKVSATKGGRIITTASKEKKKGSLTIPYEDRLDLRFPFILMTITERLAKDKPKKEEEKKEEEEKPKPPPIRGLRASPSI